MNLLHRSVHHDADGIDRLRRYDGFVDRDVLGAMATVMGSAKHVAVLTGAGISAESGIPTFRDAQGGLWAKYDPAQLATPEAFARDPELVTRWYAHRMGVCRTCRPNPGHLALTELQRKLGARGGTMTLITQNVDRLHQASGSRDVVELHGTLWIWRCVVCGVAEEVREAPTVFPVRCKCDGLVRPGVVWFGEALPAEAIERAQTAAETCDFFLSVGTSAAVYPAAGLIQIARARGARTGEVNRDPTPISGMVDFALHGLAGELLPALVRGVPATG